MNEFNPKIVAFVCNWCSYSGADKAGAQKLEYSPDVTLIRLMCSGRADPQFVLDAFKKGADGVMVLGCPPGDCHYRSGNIKAMRRYKILELLLNQIGIDRRRFKLEWVGAGESERFHKLISEMVENLKPLGPLELKGFVESEVKNVEA